MTHTKGEGRRTKADVLRRHSRKRFGQHFLEPAWVRKVVDVIDPRPDDVIVEIGPGGGALTRPLAERAAAVVAIEIDRDLAAGLRRHAPANVTVVEANVLDTDLAALVTEQVARLDLAVPSIRIAGNLPYNISSAILFRLVDLYHAGAGVTDATLMLQLEVVERLAAEAGSREYGVLSILASLHADIGQLLTLPPGAFRPPPKVWSAVVRLRFRAPKVEVQDKAVFEAVVKSIFTQRRKTLSNALKPFAAARGREAAATIAAAGLDGRRRPETLQLSELARLAAIFS
ncbi:MAG: 16S rRNA (adenine(1518)-N(6)/adenine(1519)-N(6))-dimethyltransferase RsmA [Vicinamibacterales bacterium]